MEPGNEALNNFFLHKKNGAKTHSLIRIHVQRDNNDSYNKLPTAANSKTRLLWLTQNDKNHSCTVCIRTETQKKRLHYNSRPFLKQNQNKNCIKKTDPKNFLRSSK